MGRTSTVVVDTAGRPQSITIPGISSPMNLAYDTHGRLTLVSQGIRGWRFGYDLKGRLQTLRDTLTDMTTFTYDDADRELTRTLPGGGQVQFGYDGNGNVSTITPPGTVAHLHGFDYSGVDQTLHYTPPVVSGVSAPATAYTYNNDHQLTQVTRPDGALITLGYNSTKGRLDNVTIARGQVGVSYNSTTGMVSSLSSADTVTLDYGFDGPMLTSETWSGKLPGNVTLGVGHTYTPAFTESTVAIGATSPILFSHDLDGLVTAAGALSIHHRDDNGLVDNTQAGNVASSMSYDDAGALASLSYTATGGTTIFSQSLQRDALGRITQIVENAFGTTRTLYYRYDQAGRLYGVKLNADTLATYFYDLNGNRTSVKTASGTESATYDEQDRLTSRGSTSYTYTAAGELKSKTVGSAVTQYVYDPLGNLVSVTLPSGDVVTYSADGTGRRVERRLNGAWTGGWVYRNGLNVVADLDGTGAVVDRYVYGLDDHVPALLLRGTSTYRVITDQLGSVRGVVDVSSGAVMQQTDYDAWGVASVVSGGSFQALGYAGGLTDATTGLVRFGARDYDPAAGRWTARDPIGFGGGDGNLYAYVTSEPINSIDQRGEIRDAGDDGPRIPKDSREPCHFSDTSSDPLYILLSSWGIHEAVKRDATAKGLLEPARDAWMHAEAAHRIANEFGPTAAFQMGVLQEWATQWKRNPPQDTEHDLMNNWQGLSYGMSGDELLKKGMLFKAPIKSPIERIPPQ